MAFAIGAALIGGAVGIYGANKKSQAADRATEAQLSAFRQYEPYVDKNLAGGEGALNLLIGFFGLFFLL